MLPTLLVDSQANCRTMCAIPNQSDQTLSVAPYPSVSKFPSLVSVPSTLYWFEVRTSETNMEDIHQGGGGASLPHLSRSTTPVVNGRHDTRRGKATGSRLLRRRRCGRAGAHSRCGGGWRGGRTLGPARMGGGGRGVIERAGGGGAAGTGPLVPHAAHPPLALGFPLPVPRGPDLH